MKKKNYFLLCAIIFFILGNILAIFLTVNSETERVTVPCDVYDSIRDKIIVGECVEVRETSDYPWIIVVGGAIMMTAFMIVSLCLFAVFVLMSLSKEED